MRNQIKLSIAFVAGAAVSMLASSGAAQSENISLAQKSFSVSIDEIKKSHVGYEEFSGTYKKTIITTDGVTRNIELTPTVHRGLQVVRVRDNDSVSYLGLDGTLTNKQLMIQLRDVAARTEKMKAEGW